MTAEPPPLAVVPNATGGTSAEVIPQLTPASAPIPPTTAHEGTFIAYWALFIMIAFVPAAFVAYAIRQRRLLLLATVEASGTTDAAAPIA